MASYADIEAPTVLVPSERTIPSATQPTDAPVQLLSRTRKLLSFTWTSGMTFGRCLQFFPGAELWNSLATICNTTNFSYMSYRGVKVRFTPNTTKFYRGMLGITFVPHGRNSAYSNYLTPTGLSSLPTTYLDASSCTAVEYTYPWIHPHAKGIPADLQAGTNGLGMLVLWVVDPLTCETAPGESSSITINMEATFIEPNLHDPINNGMPVPGAPPRVFAGPVVGDFAYAQGPGDSVSREAARKAKQGSISSALDTTAKIASTVSSLPVVGGFAAGLSVVASAASSVADFLGLAKPMSVVAPQWVQNNPLPYAAVLDGAVTGEVLSADQQPLVATEPSFVAADVDETSFLYMRARPTLIQRFVTKTLASDTPELLGSFPVSPYYGWKTGAPSPLFQPGNMAFEAAAKKRWRGSISYKFVIPANPLTRCRIAIMHALTKQATFTENSRYMYVDIEGTTVIDGVVPWVRREPTSPIPTLSSAGTYTDDAANGYLHVFQVSNLIADSPSVTPAPLGVLVFANADDKLQYYGLRSPVGTRTLNRGTAPPAAFLGLENSVRFDRLLSEGDIMSIRQICHRIQRTGITITVPASATLAHTPSLPDDLFYFFTAFRWWRGSVSLTFRLDSGPSAQKDFLTVAYTTDGSTEDSDVKWFYNINPIQTFTMPYLDAQGASHTGSSYTMTGLPTISFVNSNATNPVVLSVSISFNDDLTLGVPIAPWYIAG